MQETNSGENGNIWIGNEYSLIYVIENEGNRLIKYILVTLNEIVVLLKVRGSMKKIFSADFKKGTLKYWRLYLLAHHYLPLHCVWIELL